MKILCTHPGRYGDLLWALPTVRALSYSADVPRVDLVLSPKYSSAGFRTLLQRQPYIGDITVAEDWEILETAPITPRVPPSLPSGYDLVVHLGLDGWPSLSLPYEFYGLCEQQVPLSWPIQLDTPWITPLPPATRYVQGGPILVGFTDEYFEVKAGLITLLRKHWGWDHQVRFLNISHGRRWESEMRIEATSWSRAASWMGVAQLFVGCCSALHVLACAVGRRVVLVEPAAARHHDIFYPYGKLGPQVTLLTGNDGLPTVDSRHLVDAIRDAVGYDATD